MEHKQLFRPFKTTLMLHALIHSALMGLLWCAVTLFLASLVYHILLKSAPAWVLCLAGGCGFLPGAILSFIAHYPTDRRIARRLDETGLLERAGTMVACRKQDDLLVKLQKKDARAHIRKVSPKQLRLRIQKAKWISCILCVVMAAVMVLLPHNAFAFHSNLSPEEAARVQAITDLVNDLRHDVAKANFPEELKNQLFGIIDQLEQDLLATDNELDQAILIDQAHQDMQNAMQLSLSRYAIGYALQRFDLTEPLGTAILAGDCDGISVAMDDLETNLFATSANVTKLKNNINMALEDSGVQPGDMLYQAFVYFALGLEDVIVYNREVYHNGPYADYEPNPMPDVFDTAEIRILSALEEQFILEGEMETVLTGLKIGRDQLTGNQDGTGKPSQEVTMSGVGGQSDSTGSGAGGEGDGIMGGMSSGPSNSTQNTMLESIYDPISGSVSYGQVFAAYYAEYLAALEAGQVPAELQELFDRYFSALS